MIKENKLRQLLTAVSRNCEFLCKIHVYVSQEFLPLTENNQFRSSQLTPSAGTLCDISKKILQMKSLAIILSFLFLSCNNQKKAEETELKFSEIPYNLQSNYLDSIAKKIIPNKTFKYWQYATFYQQYGTGNETYTVLAEGGDLKLKKNVSTKIEPMKLNGLFEGGHPSFRSNYLVVIENQKIKYVDTMEQLRDFIGKIDNLEEALLFAKTYGYVLSSKPKGKSYNFSNGVYKLHLIKYSDTYPESTFRLRGELIELTITSDGYMKSKSMETYCEGEECLK